MGKRSEKLSALFVGRHGLVLETALKARVEEKREAVNIAQAAYDAGQADPEVLARQDASLVTNAGYLHLAQVARTSAEQAEAAYAALIELLAAMEED